MIPSVHRYELIARHDPSRKRSGALLRVDFGRTFGYADCHPWPEFGDLPLGEQLKSWVAETPTDLAKESFGCALWDSSARARGLSLFEGLTIPPSHALIPDVGVEDLEERLSELGSAGFERVKLKLGADYASELEAVCRIVPALRAQRLKARLDFNAKLSCEQVLAFIEALHNDVGLEWVDWLEDPCPFGGSDWRGIRDRFGVRLALDFAADPVSAPLENAVDVIVLKPAVQRRSEVLLRANELRIPVCVTSYLDHPVGQTYAAFVAAEALKLSSTLETCGLLSHEAYEPNAFSERLRTDGPRLIPPDGAGLGFDDLLAALPWEELA